MLTTFTGTGVVPPTERRTVLCTVSSTDEILLNKQPTNQDNKCDNATITAAIDMRKPDRQAEGSSSHEDNPTKRN